MQARWPVRSPLIGNVRDSLLIAFAKSFTLYRCCHIPALEFEGKPAADA